MPASTAAAPATRSSKGRRIAYVLRSYPRLSQTHILNEILGMERLGYEISIFGMTASGEPLVQGGVGRVRAAAEFLDAALQRSPADVARDHVALVRAHPVRYVATALYLLRRRDLNAGYTTTSRVACFMQAVQLSTRLRRQGVDHVHSHFAHDPTIIALLVHRLTGTSYSFTAHARDMYQIPTSSLAERIKHARAVVTICQANVDFLRGIADDGHGAKVKLVHTGIDLDSFTPPNADRAEAPAPRIVVVTRLVEKKGVVDLVHALARVRDGGTPFRCVIYGDGPLRAEVAGAVERLALRDAVELAGAATLEELRRMLPRADLFALTPFVTEDGDREGLPSSILEAMACGLPVVSTAVAGIPEAVVHGCTGLVAQPHDVEGIAAHLRTLLTDDALRRRLGANARRAIVDHWGAEAVALELATVFDGAP